MQNRSLSDAPVGLVQLSADHPGFRDRAYRARRDAIAHVATSHVPGTPVPAVEYTSEERGVWRTVLTRLLELHADGADPRGGDRGRDDL